MDSPEKSEKIPLQSSDVPAEMSKRERKVTETFQLAGMDHLLNEMGNPGSYQVLIFLALSSCMFPVVFNDLATIFYTLQPRNSSCSIPESQVMDLSVISNASSYWTFWTDNRSINVSKRDDVMLQVVYSAEGSCGVLESLERHSQVAETCWRTMTHRFDNQHLWSIVSEWNLVCQRYWQTAWATTIYFLGVMTGSMTLGHLADRFGRFRCIMVCYMGYLPLGITLAFVEHYWLFLILRFLVGFFIQGVQSGCFVLMMEYCPPKYREAIGGLDGLVGGLGVGALSAIAYWWQNWRYIQLCITIPTVLALFKIFFLRESLRWQMVQGKIAEARETVLYILSWNNLPADPTLDKQLQEMTDALVAEQQLEADYTWLDCFKTPKMRKYTLAQSFIWFTVLFVYYGISFAINDFSGNMYHNLMLGSAAEIPIYVVTVFFMHRFGRKKPLLVFCGLSGISCMIVAILFSDFGAGHPDLPVVRTATAFLARFFLAGSYTVVFVYGSELFPTVLRNTAFGICIFSMTFGGVAAPQVLLLGKLVHESVPFMIFGLCCLVSCLLVLTQPETLNRPMPDTIEQVEEKAQR